MVWILYLQMSDKHESENPNHIRTELLVLDILKEAFRHEGIEFESATFHRWQVVDDNILPLPIDTISALLRELRDGRYQLTINQAMISVSGKAPFEIPWICVEITYSDGQWSEPTILHDEETYDPANHETAQTLDARLKGVKPKFKAALGWVAVIKKTVETIRRPYEGS